MEEMIVFVISSCKFSVVKFFVLKKWGGGLKSIALALVLWRSGALAPEKYYPDLKNLLFFIKPVFKFKISFHFNTDII
jgi:hypothetical protein